MASSVVTVVFTTVSRMATAIAAPRLFTSSPGSGALTSSTTPPLRTSTPRPSVSTVMGRSSLIASGQISALTRPISAAAPSAAPKSLTSTLANIVLARSNAPAVTSNTTTTRSTGRPTRRRLRAPGPLAIRGSVPEQLGLLLVELLVGQHALLVQLSEILELRDGVGRHPPPRRRGLSGRLALRCVKALVLFGFALLVLLVALASEVGAAAYSRRSKQRPASHEESHLAPLYPAAPAPLPPSGSDSPRATMISG